MFPSILWTGQADPDSAQAASQLLRRPEDLQDGLDRGSRHTGLLISYDNSKISTLRLSYRALGRVEEGTEGLTGQTPLKYTNYISLYQISLILVPGLPRGRIAGAEESSPQQSGVKIILRSEY